MEYLNGYTIHPFFAVSLLCFYQETATYVNHNYNLRLLDAVISSLCCPISRVNASNGNHLL